MEYIAVGRLGRTHGLKGEIKITIEEAQLDSVFNAIEEGYPFFLEQNSFKFPHIFSQLRSNGSILKIDQINDVDEVKSWEHANIFLPKEAILEQEEQQEFSLEGYKMIDLETKLQLGLIEAIEEYPGHDMAFVRKTNERLVLIPIVEAYIRSIDEVKSAVYVELPEGLLDLEVEE